MLQFMHGNVSFLSSTKRLVSFTFPQTYDTEHLIFFYFFIFFQSNVSEQFALSGSV